MRTLTALAGMVAAAVIGAGVVVYAQTGPGWGGGYWMMNGGSGPSGYGPGGNGPSGDGPGWRMRTGYGPSWMHSWMRRGGAPAMMGYGIVRPDQNLSTDDVKKFVEQTIQNPRLKVGDVKQADDNTITADIVTKDKDVLVHRFMVNRHTGWWRPQEE